MSYNVRKCNAIKRDVASPIRKKKYRISCKTTENTVLCSLNCYVPRMPCGPSYNLHEMQEESTIYRNLRRISTKYRTKCTKEARNEYLESCLGVIEILVYLIVRFVALGISEMGIDAHGRSRVLVT